MEHLAERQQPLAPEHSFDEQQRKYTVRNADRLPDDIFEHLNDIEVLDLSGNHFSSLPDELAMFDNLRILFASNNELHSIPPVLAACEKLEMVGLKSCQLDSVEIDALPRSLKGLILTDNNLRELPESISDLPALQKLMLTGNQLTALPSSLLQCTDLELLRVSLNRLGESPNWLFNHPRLAWYADAGNPMHVSSELLMDAAATYTMADITLGDKIGESAKNIVYKAHLDDGTPVAVKQFGAGVTTDGSPHDDMAMALRAGNHPNVIGGIGRLVDERGTMTGLVMPYVPADFQQLGMPPDFSNLTRDAFPADRRFNIQYVERVAADIASAMAHLASRGVMHGDVYAHNILTRQDGRSYIGDFGASSSYRRVVSGRNSRELIDVRGYGYLLDDLLTRSNDTSPRLIELRDWCLQASVDARPTFDDIHRELQ